MYRRDFLSLFALSLIPKQIINIIHPLSLPGESVIYSRKLHYLYISPEALNDIRNWNVKYVDEVTRKELYC